MGNFCDNDFRDHNEFKSSGPEPGTADSAYYNERSKHQKLEYGKDWIMDPSIILPTSMLNSLESGAPLVS